MADINSKIEMPVTTGALPGSRKIHIAGTHFPDIRVAMREVVLEPSAKEPPVRIYDTSGPYTDDTTVIDIAAGLPPLRTPWIEARGDCERYPGRDVKPEDNGIFGGLKQPEVQQFPNVNATPWRAKGGAAVTQIAYARRGIITPEMEYVAIRENIGRAHLAGRIRDGEDFGAEIPDYVTPEFVRSEIARGRAI
ncbi:MAG: phosphomethylpyrimidine synthase ThiC, partial [Sandarakinorhabdus sp.]|nr:phosphomethylpyrimidine synthase ThiC [Sandarakinorhabdus sp.]